MNFVNMCSNGKLHAAKLWYSSKLAFECDKSFSDAITNLYQQNTWLTSGIIFVAIPYSTIYYLIYSRNSLLCVPVSKVFLDIL